jgi:hypothetical protein
VFRRFGHPALVAALIVATGGAFAVTEHLKLQPSPIRRTEVTKIFSPVCRCVTAQATIVFTLRRSDQVTLSIVRSNGDEVRRLIDHVQEPAGLLRAIWDGRDDTGRIVKDGSYFVQVHLAAEKWTRTLPNIIRVDTSPPTIKLVSAVPRTISPDGDGHSDMVHIAFVRSENARVLLYVDGRLVERARLVATKLDWHGKIAHRVRLGLHELTLRALDTAGNLSKPTAPFAVRVRILELKPTRIKTTAGKRFGVWISTDRTFVRWHFDGKSGRAWHRRLVLRAPFVSGWYRLLVRSGPYRASAVVVVR